MGDLDLVTFREDGWQIAGLCNCVDRLLSLCHFSGSLESCEERRPSPASFHLPQMPGTEDHYHGSCHHQRNHQPVSEETGLSIFLEFSSSVLVLPLGQL